MLSSKPNKILLIKPSAIGDVVHALPFLALMRRSWPHAYIAWLVTPACAGLLERHPLLSETILFDRKRYGTAFKSPAAAKDFRRFTQSLKDRDFDLVIDLQGLFRSAYLAWKTAAPTRVGFAYAREAAPLFYTHRIPPRPGQRHAIERYLDVAEALGLGRAPIEYPWNTTPTHRAKARALLSPLPRSTGGTGVLPALPPYPAAPQNSPDAQSGTGIVPVSPGPIPSRSSPCTTGDVGVPPALPPHPAALPPPPDGHRVTGVSPVRISRSETHTAQASSNSVCGMGVPPTLGAAESTAATAAPSHLPTIPPFAALIPGANWATKRWPPHRFAALAHLLRTHLHLPSVVLGAAADKPLAQAIHPDLDLTGESSLSETAALLEQATIVIANDTGPMHIAAALGRPLVTPFGPTSEHLTGPHNRPLTVLRLDLPCAPCLSRTCSHMSCLNELTEHQVFEHIKNALQPPMNADERK